MGKQVFIPMTDEILFDRPELISSPLRPYSQDLPCLHWLEIEINPADSIDMVGSLNNKASVQSPANAASTLSGAQRQPTPVINVAYPHFAAA